MVPSPTARLKPSDAAVTSPIAAPPAASLPAAAVASTPKTAFSTITRPLTTSQWREGTAAWPQETAAAVAASGRATPPSRSSPAVTITWTDGAVLRCPAVAVVTARTRSLCRRSQHGLQ
jgi:hypothetical protein